MSDTEIQQAAQIIQQASFCMALTGAGISTASGIPDFRSPDSGLWSKYDPMEVASLRGFRFHPERFYEWIIPLAKDMHHAQPNAAHLALTELESLGYLKSIITQNIDVLHHRAGSKTVYEIHGHTRTMTCIQCFRNYEAAPFFEDLFDTNNIPTCPHCNGTLKPDAILFGEQLPAQVLLQVERDLRSCDTLIITGSSLEVFPVADFPRRVKQSGGNLIIINLQSTYYDKTADVVIRDDVTNVLPQIVSVLKGNDNS